MDRIERFNRIENERKRRDLVSKLLRNELSSEEMFQLHAIDKITAGTDIVGVLFDEIDYLQSEIVRQQRILRAELDALKSQVELKSSVPNSKTNPC